MNEIFVRRDKSGLWIAYDREGNQATGMTKQIAKNQYIALYGLDLTVKPLFHLDDVEKKL